MEKLSSDRETDRSIDGSRERETDRQSEREGGGLRGWFSMVRAYSMPGAARELRCRFNLINPGWDNWIRVASAV